MTDSLRDQLLGLGFKPAPKPARVERPQRTDRGARPQGSRAERDARPQGQAQRTQHSHKQSGAKPQPRRSQAEMDLAKAYAIRAQTEKQERIEAERVKQEQAQKRREAKLQVAALLKDKALNHADADVARHFPYGGKIKRIYVTADQLKQLNAAELGVVQLDGRYLLVEAAVLDEVERILPAVVALKVDPDAPVSEDPYADPRYQVPDDIIW